MNDIQEKLFSLQDEIYTQREKYREFQAKVLVINPETIIGVRTPKVKQYAKTLSSTPEAEAFMQQLPHKYYEEYLLHAFLINECKDFDSIISHIDALLPYVENWSICDTLTIKLFKRLCKKQQFFDNDILMPHIHRWLSSEEPFTIRFGIECLLKYYLDKGFNIKHLDMVAALSNHQHYYVRIMVAWYMSYALISQWESTIPLIESKSMAKWTHNKSIQKAIESFRISDEKKAYLRTLKIK